MARGAPQYFTDNLMIDQCPWCFKEYDITPMNEQRHLLDCKDFQAQPVAEWYDNRPYIRMPGESFLVEKTPIARRAVN